MNMIGYRLLWSLIVCAVTCAQRSPAMSDPKRLIKHLLENYEKIGVVGRPVYNVSETILVKFGIALIQILELDEAKQTITTKLWERYQWTDHLLRWNMDDFGGVAEVRIPIDSIWKPDIRNYNKAGDRIIIDTAALAVVDSLGTVMWIPHTIAKSTCSLNLINFPYDTQSCSLKYGSWTYDGFKMDIEFYQGEAQMDISNYIKNNAFELVDWSAVKNVMYYTCCPEPYPNLVFTMELKRQHETATPLLVSPSIVLSLLILAIFWLPANSPVKLILGLFIYLCYIALQASTGVPPPVFGSQSRIGNFIRVSMSLDFVAILWSVLAWNLCSFRKVPCFPSKFIKCLSCCLCVRTRDQSSTYMELEMAGSGENAALAPAPSRADGNEDGLLVTAVVDRLLFVIYLVIIIVLLATSIPRP